MWYYLFFISAKQEIIPAYHEDSLVPIQRIPPISFPHEKKFTVYDSNQNLPAVLNDPRSTRRLHDFFTKTWGEEFIPCSVPALTLLPHIPKPYFNDYLRRIDLVRTNYYVNFLNIFTYNNMVHVVYRGYYTVAQTYEVYLWVEKIFHEWAQWMSEIFFPQEDNLHMFKLMCNFLFIT